ncbi:hypothetical protein FA10DRAFT_265354 [Acaromyces ingoldii]|uniref:Sec39 domain-containing protein n=1 Tax=Acaromyces ingoldii TaxID=215250 RepID=A0A316YS57_9BASI|nr:hypothetical protein FA10DRAFT_265354 [Acaromyces ingoldii]PWN91498.1 hypothetical protein FA10DRAFT_265354 [Acaromyces ingoldii]
MSALRSKERQRKRAWLRLIGAFPLGPGIDDGGGSSASSGPSPPRPPLSVQAIDASLGAITTDDVWVCTAVLDAVESFSSPLADSDNGTLRHLLDVGIAASARSLTPDSESEGRSLRRALVRRSRMLDVWERMQRRRATGQATSSKTLQAPEGEEEDDPWADEAEVAALPGMEEHAASNTTSDALAFINKNPLRLAVELAVRFEPEKLDDFLGAAEGTSLYAGVARCRLDLVRLLLVSGATAGRDLSALKDTDVLLRCQDDQEAGRWVETSQDHGDADVGPDTEGRELAGSLQELEDGQRLSREELETFYEGVVRSIEEETGSIAAAIQVTSLAPALGLSSSEIVAMKEDLESMQKYVDATSGQSTVSTSPWTLSQFSKTREEAALDSAACTRMASQFIRSSGSSQEAAAAVKSGVVPFLDGIVRRQAAPNRTPEELVQVGVTESFVALLLHLASHSFTPSKVDGLTLTRWLLEARDGDLGLSLSRHERAKVAMASVLGQQGANARVFDEIGRILATSSLSSSQTTSSPPPRTLFDVAGPVLATSSAVSSKCDPATVYPFLSSVDENALSYYVGRLVRHLEAARVFLRWTDSASPTSLAWFTQADSKREEQMKGVTKLARTFSRSQQRTGNDWSQLWGELRGLVGHGQALELIDVQKVDEIILEAILRTGDLSLYRTMHSTSSLSTAEKDELILAASRELYDNSTNPNLHTGSMKTAYDVLGLGSADSDLLKRERAFIEATSRFCSFRVSSKLHPSVPLAPIEIRLESNRLDLLARLLAQKEDAYKTPDLILDLAKKLCNVPSPSSAPDASRESSQQNLTPKAIIEVKTLAMLADAATAASDYERANALCERLVASILALRKRAQAASAHHARTASQGGNGIVSEDERVSESSGSGSGSAPIPIEEAEDIGWKTLLQVTKDPSWDNVALKLKLMGQVLSLCPPERLEQLLQTWRKLDQEYSDLVERDPAAAQKMLLQQSGSVEQGADGKGGFMVGNAAAGILGLGASAAAAAAAAAGGNLPSGIMEGATSPFSALFASAGLRSNSSKSALNRDSKPSQAAGQQQQQPQQREYGRAAQLFDGLGGDERGTRTTSGGGLYLDPAERAARAARNFFGTFSTSSSPSSSTPPTQRQGHEQEPGGEGGGGFSLSRGVGWLIGENDERARR